MQSLSRMSWRPLMILGSRIAHWTTTFMSRLSGWHFQTCRGVVLLLCCERQLRKWKDERNILVLHFRVPCCNSALWYSVIFVVHFVTRWYDMSFSRFVHFYITLSLSTLPGVCVKTAMMCLEVTDPKVLVYNENYPTNFCSILLISKLWRKCEN